MKAIGIIRHPDDLGRVVIPIEIRRSLGITDKTPLEFFATEHGIYLRIYDGQQRPLDDTIDAIKM